MTKIVVVSLIVLEVACSHAPTAEQCSPYIANALFENESLKLKAANAEFACSLKELDQTLLQDCAKKNSDLTGKWVKCEDALSALKRRKR